MSRTHILLVSPSTGECKFLFGREHGKLVDVTEIAGEVPIGAELENGRGHGVLPSPERRLVPCQITKGTSPRVATVPRGPIIKIEPGEETEET
jgi:hypothetical protein